MEIEISFTFRTKTEALPIFHGIVPEQARNCRFVQKSPPFGDVEIALGKMIGTQPDGIKVYPVDV